MKNSYKTLPILLVLCSLTGCGTLSTLRYSDSNISSKLSKSQTRCTTLSRIYSGIFFDICTVHSNSTHDLKGIGDAYYLFDTIPSSILDTVFLPYTIFKQFRFGSLTLGKSNGSDHIEKRVE
ncbi:MAG: YceK/YidQ family lipoprotein [Pseudomonadales bacterium]|nr:YceK/YidQ family lipoprotein [Pseudomonadales bacterium]